jgi:outer membrane protein
MVRMIVSVLMAAGGLALMATPVAAQGELRVAFINSQRIIAEAPAAREAQRAFEQDMARYTGELERMEQDLQRMVREYEQQQTMLSPERRREREDQIRSKQRELAQRAGELEEEAAARQAELVEPIMNRINAVIEEIRRENGYSFIFDAAAGSIIAADPRLDITDRVLTRLNSAATR